MVVTTTLEGAVGRGGAACAAAALDGLSPDASAGTAHGLATGGLLARDLVAKPPAPHGGRISLSGSPGLGIAIEPEKDYM